MTNASEAAGKMAGKVKGALSSLTGQTGILRRLKEEHTEVSVLIMRAERSDDPDTRSEVLAKIKSELLAHAHGEEQVLYPQIEQITSLAPKMVENRKEHQEMEQILGRLEAMNKDSEDWKGSVGELKRIVQLHVDKEEDEIFPEAKDHFDKDQLKEMEDRYLQIKKQEINRSTAA